MIILSPGEVGTFNANPSEGVPPYTYKWYKMDLGTSTMLRAPQPGVWIHLGYYDGSSSCQSAGTSDFKIKCEVFDKYNHIKSVERTVYLSGGGLN